MNGMKQSIYRFS